jgi:DNA-binding transcriptional LysR family regulator
VIKTDLTTIRIFLSVYHLKSLTRAAEREHIAPSAVSKRIQDIEAEFATPLFYRHPRGVTATPAGDLLARHAQRLMEDFNQMSADLSEFAKGEKGQVRINAPASAVAQYLPSEISAFARTYPGVQVILREETSPHVLQSTLDGFADIGIFVGNISAPPGLQMLSYREDRLVALVPHDHPLAGRPSMDFAEMQDSAHISLETGSSLQVLLQRAAQELGFTLNNRIEVTTFDAAMRMVDAGLGVAVIPSGIAATFASTLRASAVPLTNHWARRELVICVRDVRKLTASARLMLNHLRANAPA